MNENIRHIEKTKTNNWKYPDHFVSPYDDFTMHIPLWDIFFNELGIKGNDNLTFLELGTAQGRATVWLLENVLTGNNCFIDTVDVWRYVWYDESLKKIYAYDKPPKDIKELVLIDCVNNLDPYIKSNKCKFHFYSTKEFFLTKCNNKNYDFVYIDADHKPQSVIFDAVNSFQLLKNNGILIFDDYGWGNCKIGIDAFLSCFNDEINVIHKDWQVIIQKKS